MKVKSFSLGVSAVLFLSLPSFAGYLPYLSHGTVPSSDPNLISGLVQDNGFNVGHSQEASNGSEEEGFGTYYRPQSASSAAAPASSQLASMGTFSASSALPSSFYAYIPGVAVADVLQETVARAPMSSSYSGSGEETAAPAPSPYASLSPYSSGPVMQTPSYGAAAAYSSSTGEEYQAPAVSYFGYGSAYASPSASSPYASPYASSPYAFAAPVAYSTGSEEEYQAPAVSFFSTITYLATPALPTVTPSAFVPPAVSNVSGVPEPSSYLLFGSAVAALALRKRFRASR